MPGMYAHYRMGMEVKNDVGKREKEIIEKYQDKAREPLMNYVREMKEAVRKADCC